MRALIDEELAMIVPEALPLAFKELMKASTLLAPFDFCDEMLRVPSIKLLEHIMGDNVWVSILSFVSSPLLL